MPLQRVVERDALADQPLAVIDQQPQIEFGALELRRRQRIQAFAQRRPRDRERVDAVGLTALARAATRVGHQLGRHAHDALAALDQKPLEGARDVSAVLQRPHPSPPESARPDEQRGEPLGADLDGLLAQQLAGRRETAAIVCERLWVSAPSTIIDSSTSTSIEWTPGGHGLLGALPRSYQVTPNIPGRRRATQRKVVRPNGRQPERESARRRSRSLHLRRTSPTSRIQQQAW